MLNEEDPFRKWKAVEALARLADEEVVEPLILALSDEDWRVRQKAAWDLGQTGDQRAIVPLQRALMHRRGGVQEIINAARDRIKVFTGNPFEVSAKSACFI